MKRLNTSDADFAKRFEALSMRHYSIIPEVAATVAQIIEQVRKRGDEALDEFCRKHDNLPNGAREITKEEMADAAEGIEPRLMNAIKTSIERVRTQAEKELPRRIPEVTDETGITLGRRHLPVRRAGLYVPGGRAAYPSSLVMTAVPAKVAGVEELIAVSPIQAGTAGAKAVLATAHVLAIDRFFAAGGAHAVAALAYGTKRVPKVDIIVGPGNAFVSEAKRQLYGVVNVEGVAGPTEIIIIADESFDTTLAAADLMAQAEHAADSRCLLITPSETYATAVESALETLIPQAQRKEIITQALAGQGAIIVTRDLDEAAALADAYAPEHLELACHGAERLLAKIRNAGAVFLGPDSPEALGDYVAGSNHVLPTAGTARFFSPLSAMTFLRATNVVRATHEGLAKLSEAAIELATCEGLHAHAMSVRLRVEGKGAK